MFIYFIFSINLFANDIDNYQLGAGDKVLIKVFGQSDLDVEALLSISGLVNYPFLGEIKLTSLTVKEVEGLITQGLKAGYLNNPNVYVQVIEYRPFYIHGEVKKPGAYPYQIGMTVNQAVALAGGLTERASESKIYLFKERAKSEGLLVKLSSVVGAGDTIRINQRLF
ncbi:polysaccharide biosynthesis/export family protein [Pseudoalteromonas sp. MMG010]|uniref:polysaccharide biosynthesis/export family protein n=1 Tax=Pseudoalteromonas sp. MMG010 TaxID=2822685 RepID=UPI001FFD092F|nr:polysaccharide biosynthesis/export family protein [Pseudoalteromonas sp. MMG010]